jgi:serine/threonine protein kinase
MATMHYRPGVEAAPGYKLIELLGRGGFGEVWRAQGPGGVILAVKVIDKVDDKAGRKEFRALKLIRNLRHPNLVSISGFWLRDAEGNLLDPELLTDESTESTAHPSELIIAMELGEMSLLERLDECRKGISPDAKGGIPFDELIEYMDAAARAIDYLNVRHDIQHRDIKPQNILIVGGSAQVCDFGLASAVSSVRTSMGGAGSLAYMAPEIYSSKRPSRATDQYGLAIAYVELRTGRLPLSDTESYAVLDEAKRLGKLDLSWLSEGEARVIEKAAQLNPDERYPRCVDMVQALRSAETPTTTVPGQTTETQRPIGDYQPQRQIYRRAGEEIWEAISPERHHVTLVVRDVTESPALANSAALALTREVSKRHPRLAEMYEYARLSETGKVAPARLFEGPNPPGFAQLLLAGKLCSGNMNDRMTSGGLSAGQLLDDMEQLAEAVDFLNAPSHEAGGHKARIMHVNVRPANFQFDGGEVLLGNFSSAHLLEGDEQAFPAGRLMPDNAYNAPEFIQEKLTRWTDQYQLAVAYLQMRTGKPSSGLTSSHGGTRRTIGASRLDLADLETGERRVIERATATEPKERFDTCADMVAELRKAWEEDRPKSSFPAVDEPTNAAPDFDKTLLPGNRTVIAPDSGSGRGVALAKPAIQGTLAAPRFADTLLQPDTDPDNERRLAAERAATAAKPMPRPAIDPATPKFSPPNRSSKIKTVAMAVPLAAIVAWAVWTSFFSASGRLGNAVDSRIADGAFLEALDDIDRSDAEMSEDEREALRQQVRLAWFTKHVAPLDAERKYPEALEVLTGVDEKLAEPAQVEHWQKELVERWYAYAAAIPTDSDPIAAAREFNKLLLHRGPYSDAIAKRGNALDAAIKSGAAKLWEKPEETALVMTQAIAAIDAVKAITALPQDAEQIRRRRALVAHARAAGRLRQWEAVKQDLAALGNQLATREEKAIAKFLEIVSEARQAAASERLADARNLLQTSTADLSEAERTELTAHIKVLEGVVGGKQSELFQLQLQAAELLAEQSNYAGAASAIAKIRADEKFRDLIVGADQRRVDTLAVIATLGKADSKPAEVAKAVTAAHELCAQNSIAETGVLRVCTLVRQRALEKVSDADAKRKSPELLAQALPIVARAKSRVKVGSPDEKKIQDILDTLAAEFRADLRRERDAAGTGKNATALRPQWTKLGEQATIAENLGLADRLAQAVKTEVAIELDESGFKAADAIRRLAPTGNAKPSPDDRYVHYVIARAQDESGKLTEAATSLMAAWKGQIPGVDKATTPEETWQAAPARRRAGTDLLVRAAQQGKTGPNHDPALGEDPAKGDRFTAEAATAVYPQLALARQLADKADFDSKHPADSETVKALKESIALVSAYNPNTAEEGLRLTDALIDAAESDGLATQVYVVNMRLRSARSKENATDEDRDRFVRTAGKLLALCEAKYYDVRSETLFDRVIVPGYDQAIAAGDGLLEEGKRQGARLAAARGRYIRSIGAIEERFAQAKGGPDQVAYVAYDQAVALDPTVADYYVGRGLSFQALLEPTPIKKAETLRANAKLAEEHAKTDDERNIARGLNALALYQESDWNPDYDTKREKLSQAVVDLAKVNGAGEKATGLAKQIYHGLRVTEGTGYLHLANYAKTLKDKETYLARAKEIAQSIVEGDDKRVHPEWGLMLWGNTEEDIGMFLKETDSYESALTRFTAAVDASVEDNDPKGQSMALLSRGRCRYRQAIHASKDDAETRRRLTAALADLNESISVAGMWKLDQAQAYRWIGTIYKHPLVAETAKATENLDRAAELAKESNASWPIYELARADDALDLAGTLIDPEDLRRPPEQAEPLFAKARSIAQMLLDDTSDARIHDRHRAQAAIVVAQSQIWEGDSTEAAKTFDASLKRFEGEEAFNFALAVGKAVLDVPRGDRAKRRLSADEAILSQRAIDAAAANLKDQSIASKTDLYNLNLAYYNIWNPQFQAASKQLTGDATARRQPLDLMHHVRFHLAAGVRIENDPKWTAEGGKTNPELKKALVQYTTFLLSPNGETNWNKPGRDKARYKADAGL